MRILVSCGEPSGDLYTAALIRELSGREPRLDVVGLGGDRSRAAGAPLLADFAGISVTGLTEAVRVIPRSWSLLRNMEAEARVHRPDVCVAVDFPDFNFRLIARMHRLGVPVVYYIGPQLWAWRAGRMRAIKAHVAKMLVIFPFEQEIYERAGVDVQFIGHPLVDLATVNQSREAFLHEHGLQPSAPVVALLPGSRDNEVHRLAGALAGAARLIRARVPTAQFVVACAPTLAPSAFSALSRAELGIVLVRGRADDVLASSDVVITASGTATVQTALHERPMVVVYRLSDLTYRLVKPFGLIDMYAMPNLIAGRRVVPELIQEACTPERIAEETLRVLEDPAHAGTMRDALRQVRTRLGEPGASGRAADAILGVARRGPRR